MKEEILAIIRKECELDVTPAPPDLLTDLDTDSLSIVCAIHALEDRFEIDIPMDVDLSEFRTVGELVATVESLAETQAPEPEGRKMEKRDTTAS